MNQNVNTNCPSIYLLISLRRRPTQPQIYIFPLLEGDHYFESMPPNNALILASAKTYVDLEVCSQNPEPEASWSKPFYTF